MEIKGEQIQNRHKYSSMIRIINMQKIGMSRENLRQKYWCHSDRRCSGCSAVKQ